MHVTPSLPDASDIGNLVIPGEIPFVVLLAVEGRLESYPEQDIEEPVKHFEAQQVAEREPHEPVPGALVRAHLEVAG